MGSIPVAGAKNTSALSGGGVFDSRFGTSRDIYGAVRIPLTKRKSEAIGIRGILRRAEQLVPRGIHGTLRTNSPRTANSCCGCHFLKGSRNAAAFFHSRKVVFPLRETLGEGEKLACDGKFTPPLILFPIIVFSGISVLIKRLIFYSNCVIMFLSKFIIWRIYL